MTRLIFPPVTARSADADTCSHLVFTEGGRLCLGCGTPTAELYIALRARTRQPLTPYTTPVTRRLADFWLGVFAGVAASVASWAGAMALARWWP